MANDLQANPQLFSTRTRYIEREESDIGKMKSPRQRYLSPKADSGAKIRPPYGQMFPR